MFFFLEEIPFMNSLGGVRDSMSSLQTKTPNFRPHNNKALGHAFSFLDRQITQSLQVSFAALPPTGRLYASYRTTLI